MRWLLLTCILLSGCAMAGCTTAFEYRPTLSGKWEKVCPEPYFQDGVCKLREAEAHNIKEVVDVQSGKGRKVVYLY